MHCWSINVSYNKVTINPLSNKKCSLTPLSNKKCSLFTAYFCIVSIILLIFFYFISVFQTSPSLPNLSCMANKLFIHFYLKVLFTAQCMCLHIAILWHQIYMQHYNYSNVSSSISKLYRKYHKLVAVCISLQVCSKHANQQTNECMTFFPA